MKSSTAGKFIMSQKLKIVAASAALCLAIGGVAAAQPAPSRAHPQAEGAEPSIRSERAAHPRIVQAIKELQETRADLQAAPHDFGGAKAKAMADIQSAIHSLKKALYYRLKLDDAAIDRAE
jgi:hypothetical protein